MLTLLSFTAIGADVPLNIELGKDIDIDTDTSKAYGPDKVLTATFGNAPLSTFATFDDSAIIGMSFDATGIDDKAELTGAHQYIVAQYGDTDDSVLLENSFDYAAWTENFDTTQVFTSVEVEGAAIGTVIDGAKSVYADKPSRVAFIGNANGKMACISFDSLMDSELTVDWDNASEIVKGMVVHSYFKDADFGVLNKLDGELMLTHYKVDGDSVINLGSESYTTVVQARMVDGKRDYTNLVGVVDGALVELSNEDITARLGNNPDMQMKLAQQLGGQFGDVDTGDTNEVIETDPAIAK
jgi:hypothetical protein